MFIIRCFLITVLLLGAIGCSLDVITEDFNTELNIEKPDGPAEPIQQTKTYTFDEDPNKIDSLHLKNITLILNQPSDKDLTFLSSVKIYFENNGERILAAEQRNFIEGQKNAALDLKYTGDLKPHIDGNKFRMIWVITLNRFHTDWPESGYTMIANLNFEIDINL